MCDTPDEFCPKALKGINLNGESCKKCNGENGRPAILLRNDDKPLCKDCFLLASIHKFRSEFGKSQLIRQGEKVLVGFSGGPSSMALFEMIRIGLSENNYRKLRFIPEFIHIKENNCDVSEITKLFQNSNFSYKIIDESDLDDLRLKRINELLNENKKNATSKRAVKTILLKEILSNYAAKLGYSRLLLANNCTRLSIQTLSNISQATSNGTGHNVAFHDPRFHVSIIQPLRQFSIKEITFINRFLSANNDNSFITNDETNKPKTYSIDRLTEHFISSLTSDFPATIFTIARTAEKTKSENYGEDKRICQFCKNEYRYENKEEKVDMYKATAANAMCIALSLLKPNSSIASIEQEIKNGEGDSSTQLCYSCNWLQDELPIDLIQSN